MAHVSVTFEDAERIRAKLKMNLYEFSARIGLSPTAYLQAYRRQTVGRYMALKIAMHCPRQLAELRQ